MVITKLPKTVGDLPGLGDPLRAPSIRFLQSILEQRPDR
jgi:hypothetical protein